MDLKSRAIFYIPVKTDQVDMRLAEFINSYADRSKLKIMFLRDSAGQYMFGTRRVMIKVEREKLQVKVGGGFLLIEKFLDQYTPLELEKLSRKTTSLVTPKSKPSAIERTKSTREVRDKEVRATYETSPTRHNF